MKKEKKEGKLPWSSLGGCQGERKNGNRRRRNQSKEVDVAVGAGRKP